MATDVASTLQDQLTAHKGEMALVVSRKYRFHGCTGLGHEPQLREYGLDIDFELGIVSELGIRTAPDCVIVNTTGNHFYWNSSSKKWMESKGPILIFDHRLSDLQEPVYAPDAGRAGQQRDEERYGLKDADYALEIIIGNCEVEKYLRERTRMEMAKSPTPIDFASLKEYNAFDRERNRRCLPPAMLAEALEVSGIAEKRRLIAHELLKEQQQILRELLHNEMLQRYAGMYAGMHMDTSETEALSEKQKELVARAIGKKVYTLESFEMDEDMYLGESTRNFDIMGVKIVINPNAFIETLAKKHHLSLLLTE